MTDTLRPATYTPWHVVKVRGGRIIGDETAAPWNERQHAATCPWNVDSRSDRKVPTHRCDEGHYFNDNSPALNANRLTKCPLFHFDETDYDDGPCDAEIRELECACERLGEDPNAP